MSSTSKNIAANGYDFCIFIHAEDQHRAPYLVYCLRKYTANFTLLSFSEFENEDVQMDCNVAVVFLSEYFIQSLRAMHQLHKLFEAATRDPAKYGCSIVYPIFYHIKPSDLVKDDNLRRWKAQWHYHMMNATVFSKLGKGKQHQIHNPGTDDMVSGWPRLLQEIGSCKGSIFRWPNFRSFARVAKDIMLVCRSPSFSGDRDPFMKGKQRIVHIIDDYFDLLFKFDDLSVMGVVGTQGSGKTTLCRAMVDFYNQFLFSGKSFMLELPSCNSFIQKEQLIQQLNTVIRNHDADSTLIETDDLNMAISMFWNSIAPGPTGSCFLAIDNVTYFNKSFVEDIIQIGTRNKIIEGEAVECIKILLTSRCKALLTTIELRPSTMKIINVPSLNKEEALDALLSYSGHPEFYHADKESCRADLERLVELCFLNDFVNPELLKTLGKSLSVVNWQDLNEWKDHIRNLQTCCSSLHNGQLDGEYSKIIPDDLKRSILLSSGILFTGAASIRSTLTVPLIYLSHSHEQSHVAALLYEELLRSYDKSIISHDENLPIIWDKILPPNTVQFVIVSENFLIRVLSNDLPLLYGHLIPVFCNEIRPNDLIDEGKLQEWINKTSQPFDNIKVWKAKLKLLRDAAELPLKSRNVIFENHLTRNVFENLTRNVSLRIPPSHLCEGQFMSNIVGCDHIAETIFGIKTSDFRFPNHIRFQEFNHNHNHNLEVTTREAYIQRLRAVVGVYGVPGSGKTVICKSLVTFFFEHYQDFVGKSGLLELPTEENHITLLTEFKKILKLLLNASDNIVGRILDLHQAVNEIKKRVRTSRIFLAIDNVRDWSKHYVAEILNAMSGESRVFVTSRNRKVLEFLNVQRMMCVPTLTTRETWEAFWRYFLTHKNIPRDYKTYIEESTVYELCSFTYGCHPKLLYEISKFFSSSVIEKEILMDIYELRKFIYSNSRDIRSTIITALNVNDVDIKDEKWQEILSNVTILFSESNLFQISCTFTLSGTCICIWSHVEQSQIQQQNVVQIGKGEVGMWKINTDFVEYHTLYKIDRTKNVQSSGETPQNNFQVFDECHSKVGKILGIQEASEELYLQYHNNKK